MSLIYTSRKREEGAPPMYHRVANGSQHRRDDSRRRRGIALMKFRFLVRQRNTCPALVVNRSRALRANFEHKPARKAFERIEKRNGQIDAVDVSLSVITKSYGRLTGGNDSIVMCGHHV